MRLLFLGDIVGRAGRSAVVERLPGIVAEHRIDAVVCNGENAAHGFGITEAIYNDLVDAGCDAVTLGNHAWDQREALVFIARAPRLVRPANFPRGTPGRGSTLVDLRNGARLLVVNVMGRVFMDAMDDPFAAVEREIELAPLGAVADAIVVDVHAEATAEKQAIGYMLDGRASLVVGTHTHVPTADHRILARGTAYQTDVGMCGDFDSVIGMHKDEPLRRMREKTPGAKLEPAEGPATLCGIIVDLAASGLATAVTPLRVGGVLSQT